MCRNIYLLVFPPYLTLYVTFKWCAHAIDSKESQANVFLIGAMGFKRERDGDNDNPLDVPLCKIKTKTTESVTWSVCRDQLASLIDIPNISLTAENWGVKWKVYASVGSAIVPAKPNTMYSSMVGEPGALL